MDKNENIGYRNIGSWNVGDQNIGYHNAGHCNSIVSIDILVFNKLCTVEKWNNCTVPLI